MIIYTRLLWFAAGFSVSQRLILIRPEYRDDLPLLRHEQCHQQQMKRVGTVRFWWRYITDSDFRQAAEVEAYRVQIDHGARLLPCAANLVTKYYLRLMYPDAVKLLTAKD